MLRIVILEDLMHAARNRFKILATISRRGRGREEQDEPNLVRGDLCREARACSLFVGEIIMNHAYAHARYAPTLLSRRRLLQAGTLGWAGLNLAALLRAEEQRAARSSELKGQIRSCILLYYYGGPSHL